MDTTIVQYYGIDSWNRPVFKAEGRDAYFGSLDKLYGYDTPLEVIQKEITEDDLSYFGNHFDCEPYGLKKDVKINWGKKEEL